MLIVKEKKLIFMMKTLHPKIYIFISIKHNEKKNRNSSVIKASKENQNNLLL